ncbi:glucosylglycerol-phosphate synthase [Sphingobacterium cellulitidis]|uniref:Alpha,alpha-trehalose-phosphate synthase n=1 Tax=Sphingobacterium cellulitidis TaxID=1768011 RepID=A0A8H9FXY7_9SPHI|nr:glucosylglycerol-phosphate synthase [Sphingobacterium soli]MBA8984961.1 glucosylglycerol-phosphate synthase [Sphingobacterium soli]GGE13179.1 alpha,alpha-trehalose-phosphate synthase [Sphingobacterium soli]
MMLLATDLDGTFLGGSMEDRLKLYQIIKENKNIKLVFVTGRGLESVIPLLNDPTIPRPHFIIADVGATICDGATLIPVDPIQHEIESNWPSVYELQEDFSDIPGLEYQRVPQQRRCSYFYDLRTDLAEVRAIAELRKCEVVTSLGKYLDILPKGVNKGSTLKKLVDHLGFPESKVLVAGDTLNDLSLFHAGFQGVAVGRSEIALLEATESLLNVYQAHRPGAGGILECMEEYSNFSNFVNNFTEESLPRQSSKDRQLVMVYHRLPYDRIMVEGKLQQISPKSPNGIIPSLLGLFEKGRPGIWIGEEVDLGDGNKDMRKKVDANKFPNLDVSAISLSQKDIDKFYRVFSKEAFWPTIFSFVDKAKFNHLDWEHYLKINKLFAQRIARDAEPEALVWIHEYNLWMVPSFLKMMRPDLKIGFFHHTAFPAADIFNTIPWRREIIGSLLMCDFISFHIPRYVENFIDVLRSHTPFRRIKTVNVSKQFLTYSMALGVEEMTKLISVEGRTIRLGAQPVGVNYELIENLITKDGIAQRIEKYRSEVASKDIKRIVSIERMDYVKGPLEKVLAFGEFLKEYPEFRGRVELIDVCTPPSKGMRIYDKIRDQVNQAVGEINGRYATLDWTPIQYFFQALPFEEVLIQYALADVAWITPLRDGLNLVSKEFVATQGILNQSGVLVLSEFAGASVELPYCVPTNPYDRRSMIESLHQALTMPEEEALLRIKRSLQQIKHYDVQYWGEDFVRELEKSNYTNQVNDQNK